MHPILIEVAFSTEPVSLWWVGLGAAAFGCLLLYLALRTRQLDLLLFGAVATVGGLILGVALAKRSISVGAIEIPSYGVMLALSLVVGWGLTLGLAQNDGIERTTAANAYVVTALGALAGARLLYVFTNLSEFQSIADVLALRRGGMTAYGGFVGGFVAAYWYWRRRAGAFWLWADAAAPSLAVGLALTRIGCYLFGCDYGRPLGAAAPGWLQTLGSFPRWENTALGAGSPAYTQHVLTRGLSPDAFHSLPVHPTQLYESLFGAALVVLCLVLRRRRRFAGQVVLSLALAYAAGRFCLEFLRDDPGRGFAGPVLPLGVSFGVGIALIAAAAIWGPLRRIEVPARRLAALGVLGAAVVASIAWSSQSSSERAWSTSQWFGVVIAALVAWVYGRREADAAGLHAGGAFATAEPSSAAAVLSDDAPPARTTPAPPAPP